MQRICVLLALAWAASAALPLPASLDGECRRAIYKGLHVRVPSRDRAISGLREAQRAVERLSAAGGAAEQRRAACEAGHEGLVEKLTLELMREYKAASVLEKAMERARAANGTRPATLRRLFYRHAVAEVRAHKKLLEVERELGRCQGAAQGERGGKEGRAAPKRVRRRLQRAERAAAMAEGAARCRTEVEPVLQRGQEKLGGRSAAGAVKRLRAICPDLAERFAPTNATLSPAGRKAFCAGAVDSAQLMLEAAVGGGRAAARFCGNAQDPARFLRRFEAGPRALQRKFCGEQEEGEASGGEEPESRDSPAQRKAKLVYGLNMHAPQFGSHRRRHAAPELAKCLRRCRESEEIQMPDCLRNCFHNGAGGTDQ